MPNLKYNAPTSTSIDACQNHARQINAEPGKIFSVEGYQPTVLAISNAAIVSNNNGQSLILGRVNVDVNADGSTRQMQIQAVVSTKQLSSSALYLAQRHTAAKDEVVGENAYGPITRLRPSGYDFRKTEDGPGQEIGQLKVSGARMVIHGAYTSEINDRTSGDLIEITTLVGNVEIKGQVSLAREHTVTNFFSSARTSNPEVTTHAPNVAQSQPAPALVGSAAGEWDDVPF